MLVAHELDPLEGKVVDLLHLGGDLQRRLVEGGLLQVLPHRLLVVLVEVEVPKVVDVERCLEAGDVRYHAMEQPVPGEVPRDAEEHVAAPLVDDHLKLVVAHEELVHHVARRQRHPVKVGHIPAVHDEAPPDAGGGVLLHGADPLDDGGELVNHRSIGPHAAPPLCAIDRAQVAVGSGPLIPDADIMSLEVVDVGAAGDHPQDLAGDPVEVDELAGEDGEVAV